MVWSCLKLWHSKCWQDSKKVFALIKAPPRKSVTIPFAAVRFQVSHGYEIWVLALHREALCLEYAMEKEFIFFTLSKPAVWWLHHISGTLRKNLPLFSAELLCRVFIYDGKPSSWKDGSIENTWLPWVSFSPGHSAKRCVLRTYTKLMLQFFDTVKFQMQIHNYNIPWTI